MKRILRVPALVLTLGLLLGIAVFAEEKPFYVALGDSIAEGTGLRNADAACYGALVAATNGYGFVNHAIGGHQTTDLLARLEEEAVRADIAKADIISISIGGNDFLLGGMYRLMLEAWVCNDYTWMDRIITDIYENFCKIITEIKTLNPDAQLLVQTLYNTRTDYAEELYQIGLEKLNGGYARYLAEHPGSFVIVDAGAAVEAREGMIAKDNIHPNAKGHEAIARAYLATLKDLGLGTVTEPVIAEKGEDDGRMLMLQFIMPLIFAITLVVSLVKGIFG